MDFETIPCPGRQALRELRRLRQQFPTSGKYPFLIGREDSYLYLEESAENDERTCEKIIAESDKIDIPEWLSQGEETEEIVGGMASWVASR
ncbi:MAG: hypothetical protein ACFCD0_10235 [Gemmataceae bacterium]